MNNTAKSDESIYKKFDEQDELQIINSEKYHTCVTCNLPVQNAEEHLKKETDS